MCRSRFVSSLQWLNVRNKIVRMEKKMKRKKKITQAEANIVLKMVSTLSTHRNCLKKKKQNKGQNDKDEADAGRKKWL